MSGIYRVLPGDPLTLGRERAIVMRTTNAEPGVTLNGTTDKDHVNLVIRPDRDDARRLAKVLRHLIQLCGGKKNLF